MSLALRHLHAALLFTLVLAMPLIAQEKRQLEHADYDHWKSIRGQQLSPDGQWLLHTIAPAGEGDSTLFITRIATTGTTEVVRGTSARFTDDSKYAIYLVQPDPDAVKKAQKEKEEQPRAQFVIHRLDTGDEVVVDRVRSFQMPAEAAGWVAYLMHKPPEEKKEGEAEEEEPTEEAQARQGQRPRRGAGQGQRRPGGRRGPGGQQESADEGDEKTPGTDLILRNIESEEETVFPNVISYRFTEDGARLIFMTSAEEAKDDGVFVVDLESGDTNQIIGGLGHYKSLAISESGQQIAFLSDRDDYEAKQSSWTVYHWRVGDDDAEAIAREGDAGIPEGSWVADRRAPSFSHNGERVFFATAPRPEPEPEEEEEGEEEEEEEAEEEEEEEEPPVRVDIWHWKDPQLQPQQLIRANQQRNQSFQAVVHLDSGRIVQLGDQDLPNVNVGSRGDADIAVGSTNLPYLISTSWDTPGFNDIYLVDVTTGERELVFQKQRGGASLSPQCKYLTWWSYDDRAWYAMNLKSRQVANLTERMPHVVHNELDDHPQPIGSYGSAGWLKDDMGFIIYDRYDVWVTNPGGFWPPICITDGEGRKNTMRFRVLRLDRENDYVDPDEPLLLSAFNHQTKAAGYFEDNVRGDARPVKLIMRDESISAPSKADDADRYLFTRQTFQTFPDLWVSDTRFRNMKKLSDANPQQSEYTWGSAEIVEWTSLHGEKLQGILYKPDGFNENKQYPMLVYFYERSSDGLHRYMRPAPGSSSINRTFYVSRGYLVFVPDIPYRIGFPGESCESAVLPGVAALIDEGFVDKDRIGVQGHSWGGYQISHLVTRTNIFAAAEAGAPVSNMVSAYGGIRWGSGMSRMFQYENTQSRIGGSLWEEPERFIENSPIFWADKIHTPLLILHNDQDGAVPWYQGIELFVAMRRLGKPAWMFNYNGEDHGLRQRHNQKDWTIRLQQFFDHYLKDAPAPVWLAEGVPAVKKGETLGLELVTPETSDQEPGRRDND